MSFEQLTAQHIAILAGQAAPQSSLAEGRNTTIEEDGAYCLIGIFASCLAFL